MPALAEREKLPSLTGVRGIAVLLVVLQHSWLASHHDGTPFIDHWLKSFAGLWFGVDLFFVLSGFLLTRILLETKESPNYFRSFYARRCLRIFPVYYAFVLAVVIGGLMERCSSWTELPWVITFLTNVSICLKHSWTAFLVGIPLNHFWSLSVEEHFYIAWPIVVKKNAQRLFWLCAAGIALTTLLRCVYLIVSNDHFAVDVVHILTPFRMDGLLAGAAVACIHHTGAPSRKRGQMALLISGGVFGALLLMTHMDYSNRLVASFGYTIIAIASACLVSYLVAANRGDRLNEFFSHRSLVFFGRYSYAMYVVHLPIATLFNSWIQILKLGTSPVAVIVIGMIAPFVCTVLLSMLSWHLLEKRILNWRGRFS